MDDELKFNQEYISYKPKQQKVYPIQEHDWIKLKDTVNRCKTNGGWSLKDVGLLLLGGGLSALLSLIALYNSSRIADWILNANWIIFISAIIIGIVLLNLDKKQSDIYNLDIDQIVKEMTFIEEKYYYPEDKQINNKDIKVEKSPSNDSHITYQG